LTTTVDNCASIPDLVEIKVDTKNDTWGIEAIEVNQWVECSFEINYFEIYHSIMKFQIAMFSQLFIYVEKRKN
jgi:hypothetical protein